jgi:MFS family permease
MLLALTTHILVLILLFGGVLSIAMGGSSLTTTSALLAKWFDRRRATAVALNASGASVGGLLLVPLTVYLIHFVGWRMAWVVLGLLLLTVVVPLAYALLKDDPAELGLLPDGAPQPLGAGQTAPARRGPLEVEHWQQSFRSTPIWQLCGGYFVCGFTIALISTHFVPFAIERGVAATTAATAYGLMSGLNVVGVLAVGALADRGGRKNLLGLVYALRGCAYAALLLAPGALEPVGLCRDHGLFLVGHAPPDQCAHSGGLWPEAPRHPQRPRLHGAPDRGGAEYSARRHSARPHRVL